jgi:hypothetical protein
MRLLPLALLLCLAAPGLAAQQRAETLPPVERPALTHTVARADPVPVAPSGEEARPLEASRAEQAAAQPAALDEAFWRQVLAGVIVTVVSTLILRAIL